MADQPFTTKQTNDTTSADRQSIFFACKLGMQGRWEFWSELATQLGFEWI
jgi:hypothetical protein